MPIEEPVRENEREVISRKLFRSEELLDRYTVAMNDTNNGKRPRYGDLMARLHLLKQHGIRVFGELGGLYSQFLNEEDVLPDTIESFEEKRAEIKSFIEIYKKCNYGRNPWRELKKDISIVDSEIMQIEASFEPMVNHARTLESSAKRCVHSEESAWLAEHSWLTKHYPAFLPDKLRQDQQNFQKLAIETRKLSNWLLEKSIRELLDHTRHSQSIAEHYQNFLDSTKNIHDICHIHRQISQNRLLRLFSDSLRPINDWPEIFEAAVFQTWLKEFENHNKIAFIGTQEIKNQQKALKDLFDKKRRADIRAVRSHFISRIYYRNELEGLGLLRQKRSKYASKTSLRQLYSQGFESIHGIYPVLLTNPETASSILELRPDIYDILIIDEASQMFMADAMPILYRARTVVISGDEMQMPPSDLFMLNMGDDDADPDEGYDKERPADQNRLIAAEGEYCLLDAAEHAIQRGGSNEKRLLVHYRSECKELIDFSNHAFYDGKLIAPSGNKRLPRFLRTPIELHPVRGIFSSGINEIEARAVVEKVKEIWQVERSLSMGVIAFNIRQRDKIEDLLAEESQQNTLFGQMLDQERNRTTEEGEDIGFFVRSVEHVQGDERDIIILSTTYSGETRNFGPISKKEKGRRRLNVAITRAKCGMIVISSLNIDHISNEGERNTRERYYFWKYMCYARAIDKGEDDTASQILRDLSQQKQTPYVGKGPESPFEEQVAEFLTKEGFHVDYQVGESGFRIDLGLKQQQEDPLYICGVECDGRQYHSGWKARMNDIWRQKILESKGWKIVRIWSSDWFGNPEHARQTLISQIKEQ
ncbi:AAA domain-containing protein [Desulfococcaceae bacterium HSG8]|nr:AAA domain-containing protein [Desulfococcaceae bacterium HSG8]